MVLLPRKQVLAASLLKVGAFQRGHFVLASGKESNVYVNCRKATLNGEALAEIAGQFIMMLIDLDMNAADMTFGGVTSGADPIVAGFLALMRDRLDINVNGFFVRKEAKTHGTKEQIEGNFKAGDNVVIFDDVATTGGSSQIAVDAVKAAGGKVQAVMVIVDREEGAKERFAEQGIPLHSLITLKELEELTV